MLRWYEFFICRAVSKLWRPKSWVNCQDLEAWANDVHGHAYSRQDVSSCTLHSGKPITLHWKFPIWKKWSTDSTRAIRDIKLASNFNSQFYILLNCMVFKIIVRKTFFQLFVTLGRCVLLYFVCSWPFLPFLWPFCYFCCWYGSVDGGCFLLPTCSRFNL